MVARNRFDTFHGQESGTGAVEGKYFNEIIRALCNNYRSSALAEALGWMTKMHGCLSFPAGAAHDTAHNLRPTFHNTEGNAISTVI